MGFRKRAFISGAAASALRVGDDLPEASRQAGSIVSHKRVDRLYTEEKLQIKRRPRKKGPISERQPLVRPTAANEVCSMGFVFDRVAN